ncbi:MAG: tRNA 2-thiocytidine biosynthesis TtcA family protein [Desulfurococcaceae archaeon]
MKEGDKVLVAVSGGKDSLSLLYILASLINKLKISNIIPFHLDLGLDSFSEKSIEVVKTACNKLGLKSIIISLRDVVGYDLPELIRKTRRPACSLCGLIKRYFVNLVGVISSVDIVTLGHHMDDILVFILKDFMVNDLLDMAKMTPITPGLPSLLSPKAKILYEIYENDLAIYAKIRGIAHVDIECPFKYTDPLKTSIRRMIDDLDKRIPGFKIMLARRFARSISKITPPIEEGIKQCKYCGMPSRNGLCGFCRLTMRLYGEPVGLRARDHVIKVIKTSGLL